MPKLLIYRGEALLDERELTGQTVRIGRSSQNDVVLEDPGKGVSRNHAEIRFEGDRYTLVDLQSQNGIWVAGTRVPSVALDPGVVATVGPFRLTVEAPAPAVAAADLDTAPLELTQFSDRATDPLVLIPAEPAAAEAPPPSTLRADDAPRAKTGEAHARPKEIEPQPRAKDATVRPGAGAAPSSSQARFWGAIAAAILLVAVTGVLAYKMTHKVPAVVWDSAVAQALIASGRCQEAMEKEIDPALRADPNNREAQSLKQKCAAPPTPEPPPPTTSVPPAPTVAERLDQVEALIASNECPRALEAVNAVLAEDAANERAKALSTKVNACLNPAPVQPVSNEKPQLKPIPPERGGLTPLANETPKDYANRVTIMRQRYADALADIDNRRYLQARRALEDLWQEVPPGYLDLAQRREELRNTMRAEAKNRLEVAQAADTRNEFDAAIEAYRRAHDLDPGLQVDVPIQRVTERKVDFGRKRCQAGRLEFSYGNNIGAVPMLQDAVKYLPAGDECAAKARQILQQLGK